MAGVKGKNRHNATGRSRTATFVQIFDALVTCAAWLAASGGAIKLLVYMMLLSKGNNGYGHKGENGRLFLSERQAGLAIGVARNTASKLFAELQDLGFIRVIDPGHFQVKVRAASTWRLTFQPTPWNSRPATNEWRSWTPEQNTRAQYLNGTGATIEAPPLYTGANIGPVPQEARSADPLSLTGANTGPHIDVPRQGLVGGEPKPRVQPPACSEIPGGVFADCDNVTPFPSAGTCEQCSAPFRPAGRGKPKRFCSEPCRKSAERARRYRRTKDEAA